MLRDNRNESTATPALMTTVARFAKPEDAHLIRMRLGEAGIDAFVLDENLIQIDPFYSNALGGVRVQVADEDAAAAREFLATDTGVAEEL